MAKKPIIKTYIVDLSFYSCEKKVKARTPAEARKKAIAQLQKRGLASLVNKNCTYTEKVENSYRKNF